MSNTESKSTIFKDTLVLVVITVISGFLLGLVYEVTKPIIDNRKLEKKTAAFASVYADAEFEEDVNLTAKTGEASTSILEKNGYKNVTIDDAYIAVDASGNQIGYVMAVTTKEGYKDAITVSLGISLDGEVKGMEVISINETVGLGSLAAEENFTSQFEKKTVDKFEVTKTGATNENQIDALSGATITTNAVVGAVNSGLSFFAEITETGNN